MKTLSPKVTAMIPRMRHVAAIASLALTTTLYGQNVELMPPPTVQVPDAPAEQAPEVLARGQIHEAFATSTEMPQESAIIKKAPPALVEELPPDQKPEGDDVVWIPGYWAFDDDRSDFIWISGFWRVPPPGRIWVAGSWRETADGWQWISGFWQAPQAESTEIELLPPPPEKVLAVAASVPAPTATSVFVPGHWVWHHHRYVWRPGFWIEHRPNWVWVPAHYRWTPVGWVFIDGYWDRPLPARGVLFAPVAFRPVARKTIIYTPTYAVATTNLYGALFVRTGCGGYYFGDYFEAKYVKTGYNPWCGTIRDTKFELSINFGRPVDPLWVHYHMENPKCHDHMTTMYTQRFKGDAPRPPQTLIQQTTIINNITNNNTTIIKEKAAPHTTATAMTLVAPVTTLPKIEKTVALKVVTKDDRAAYQAQAKQIVDLAAQRRKAEANIAVKNIAPVKATDKPAVLKLEVPKPVAARALATPTNKEQAPPPVPVQPKVSEVKPVPAPTPPTHKVEVKPVPAPTPPTHKVEVKPVPAPTPPTHKVEVKPVPAPTPPTHKVEVKPVPAPTPTPKPEVKIQPAPIPAPKVEVKPVPAPTPPTHKVEVKPVPAPTPAPKPEVKIQPAPIPAPKIEVKPVVPPPAPKVEVKPVPPAPKPEVKVQPAPIPAPQVEIKPVVPPPAPKVEVKPVVPPAKPDPKKVDPKKPETDTKK